VKHCRVLGGKKSREILFDNVEVFFKEDAIPEKVIPRFVSGSNPFLSSAFLNWLLKFQPLEGKSGVSVAYLKGIPVSALMFSQVEVPLSEFIPEPGPVASESRLGKWLGKKMNARAAATRARITIFGNALHAGSWGWQVSLEKAESAELLSAHIRETAEKIDAQKPSSHFYIVKDFVGTDDYYSEVFERDKYRKLPTEPKMILEVDPTWENISGYEMVLKKKYRKRFRDIRKRGVSLEVFELGEEDLKIMETEIHALFEAVQNASSFNLVHIKKGYFRELKKIMKEEFSVFGYRMNHKLVGFRSGFYTPAGLETHFIGLDYSFNREFELYQNMLYDYLEEGIRKKVKQVDFGRTASEIKSNLGAIPLPVLNYVRATDTIGNKLLKPFVKAFKPEAFTLRNPFSE
jgi:hypothetical protein